MPKGTVLTPSERASISLLNEFKLKQEEIAVRTKRSQCVISTYLHSPEQYGSRSYELKRRKIDDRGVRQLVREAEKGAMSSRELVSSLKLGISDRHARRLLEKEGLKFGKPKRRFGLTKQHKGNRVKWSKDKAVGQDDLEDVVFSDYSNFTLDGSQNLRSGCWYRPNAPVRPAATYVRRGLSGKKGVMVWVAISSLGGRKSTLAFVEGKIDARRHIDTLDKYLLPFIEDISCKEPEVNCRFQEDNASIHTAKLTKEWLNKQNFEVLEWPAKSPDLNPVENVWSELARKVYDNGRKQYNDLDALKVAIQKAWDELEFGYIDSLFNSMPKRFAACIRAKGEKINY